MILIFNRSSYTYATNWTRMSKLFYMACVQILEYWTDIIGWILMRHVSFSISPVLFVYTRYQCFFFFLSYQQWWAHLSLSFYSYKKLIVVKSPFYEQATRMLSVKIRDVQSQSTICSRSDGIARQAVGIAQFEYINLMNGYFLDS